MKKIINIHLAGRLIPIEDTAYKVLRTYIDSLARHFGKEEGGHEIVSDIEDRIAEVFQERLKKGIPCITDEDVNNMIESMGRPEQLEEETSTEPGEKKNPSEDDEATPPKRLVRNKNDQMIGGVCSGLADYFRIDPVLVRVIALILICLYGVGLLAYILFWIVLPGVGSSEPRKTRRFYRDPDNKVLGGVASGLAAYFKTDPVFFRVIFVIPLLGIIFSNILRNSAADFWGMNHFFYPFLVGGLPTLVVLYFILWIAMPKATTQAEKLEMRGEEVNLHSLSVAHVAEEGGKRKETAETLVNPSPKVEGKKHNGGFGEIILTLLRFFLYFILGVLVFSISASLIGVLAGFLGLTAIGVTSFPLHSIILDSQLQHMLVWPAIILTFGIPIVALIWWMVRLVGGFKKRSKPVGIVLLALWLLGIIFAAGLSVSVAKDFRKRFSRSEEFVLTQPEEKLILRKQVSTDRTTPGRLNLIRQDWIADFIQIGDDHLDLKTVKFRISESSDSNFHAEIVRFSNGRSEEDADRYLSGIGFPIKQSDSILYVPDRISLTKSVPFRNQQIFLEIFVPEGKTVEVKDKLERIKTQRSPF